MQRISCRAALSVTLCLVSVCSPMQAQQRQGKWGDQGDGTYINPVMPGDFSDLDAIRAGSDFYAISSTFQYSPGIAVLHSKDLVNWRIAGHVVPDLTRISPELNWDRMNRYGRGIWAGSIRFHAGKYWVYFGTPDEGVFMSTARDPAGPWTDSKIVLAAEGWDDPCPFWDTQGHVYLVATHFATEQANGKAYNIHLFELTSDGKRILTTTDRIIHRSNGSEANKLYKFGGRYYHFYSEVAAEGRVIMMERAKLLSGPWEVKQLIHVNAAVDKEPNQGGLIELASGKFYFVSHQGAGDWEGRAGVLLPVTWIAGWPIIGKPGPDGVGNMVWRDRKPIGGFPLTSLVASDDFSEQTLKPEWEWNYQPRSDKWSLAERPGFLRLHPLPPLRNGDFKSIPDILTQRSMRTARNEVTVKLDVEGLRPGQEAGLAHYADTFCTLTITQSGATRHLTYNNNGAKTTGPKVVQTTVWLRSRWNFDGQSQFSFSLDGSTFEPFGSTYQLTWGGYRGDRIGIFTTGTDETGHVDVDSFAYGVHR